MCEKIRKSGFLRVEKRLGRVGDGSKETKQGIHFNELGGRAKEKFKWFFPS